MKLLITGAFTCTDRQKEHIASLGHELVFHQDERTPILFDVSDIEGVICNGLFLYTSIDRFTSLKFIQITSAGLDRVPLDYIHEHDIALYNARGVYSVPMAEFALSGVLQLYKQSKFFYQNQLLRRWDKRRNLLEVSGKTVCIVGCGSIGTECAKRFRAMDAIVIGIDLYPDAREYFNVVKPVDEMARALTVADIVILTLPLTDANRGLFDESVFSIMKSNAVLVNISRGQIVNESALINALKAKQIAAAVLDVFEEEPLSKDSPLWRMDNVILSPHNSFVGENNSERLYDLVIRHLKGNQHG